MNRRRDMIHITKIDEFKKFIQDLGFQVQITKYDFEVFRVISRGKCFAIFYQRGGTDHLTTFGEGTKLAHKYIAKVRAERQEREKLKLVGAKLNKEDVEAGEDGMTFFEMQEADWLANDCQGDISDYDGSGY